LIGPNDLLIAAIAIVHDVILVTHNVREFSRWKVSRTKIGRREYDFGRIAPDKAGHILRIAAQRGAHNIRIFGSVARGDSDATSDIDFLVDLEPERSLFDLSGLLIDLEAILQTEVDVVTERGLRARIRDRVLREAVPL
jgi:uncharacterized protein